jgi:hypothetical protein
MPPLCHECTSKGGNEASRVDLESVKEVSERRYVMRSGSADGLGRRIRGLAFSAGSFPPTRLPP